MKYLSNCKNAPCRKGCIACCFQPINLATIEESKIRNKLTKDIEKNINKNHQETKKRRKIPMSQINKIVVERNMLNHALCWM